MKKTIKENQDKIKRRLTFKEAMNLLAPHLEGKKKRIHTITLYFDAKMGSDVDLSEIKKRMKEANQNEIYITTDHMFNHNVVFFDPKYKQWMWLETDAKKHKSVCFERKIA